MAHLGMYEVMCPKCSCTSWKMLVDGRYINSGKTVFAISECADCGEQFSGPFNQKNLKAPEPRHERA